MKDIYRQVQLTDKMRISCVQSTNLKSDGRSGVVLSSFRPAAIKRGRLSTKLGSVWVPLALSRSSEPRSGDGLDHASHQRAVCTIVTQKNDKQCCASVVIVPLTKFQITVICKCCIVPNFS